MSNLLKIYDFPDPVQTAGGRDLTTTPLQQLFIMNSPFLRTAAEALASAVGGEPDNEAKVRSLYRKVLARDPSAHESELALSYLSQGSVEQYAQVLLLTNELMFLD